MFGQDSGLGVNCNCNLFPVTQYRGLKRKAPPSNTSQNNQYYIKIKDKISLRKPSLGQNKEQLPSRRVCTPDSDRSAFPKSSYSTHKKSQIAIRWSKPEEPPKLRYDSNQDRNETQIKLANNSHSPHFRNIENYKSNKICSDTKALVKKHQVRQITFKDTRPIERALFQDIEIGHENEKPTLKQQKCSFTTMAGSNGFNVMNNRVERNFEDEKEDNFDHQKQNYNRQGGTKLADIKHQTPVHTYSLSNLYCRPAESMIGDGQRLDESDFSEVVNSSKRIQGLDLFNNYHHVNPFFKDDLLDER